MGQKHNCTLPRSNILACLARSASRQQGGFVLVTALLFLVALTVVGISAVGTNVIEERLSGQARDRQIATEAAEAALRDGERFIMRHSTGTGAGIDPNLAVAGCGTSGDTLGLCVPETTTPLWRTLQGLSDSAAATWITSHMLQFGNLAANASTATFTISADPDGGSTAVTPSQQPRYVIEILPPKADNRVPYRITAVGFGRKDTTRVILQSIFVPL